MLFKMSLRFQKRTDLILPLTHIFLNWKEKKNFESKLNILILISYDRLNLHYLINTDKFTLNYLKACCKLLKTFHNSIIMLYLGAFLSLCQFGIKSFLLITWGKETVKNKKEETTSYILNIWPENRS